MHITVSLKELCRSHTMTLVLIRVQGSGSIDDHRAGKGFDEGTSELRIASCSHSFVSLLSFCIIVTRIDCTLYASYLMVVTAVHPSRSVRNKRMIPSLNKLILLFYCETYESYPTCFLHFRSDCLRLRVILSESSLV